MTDLTPHHSEPAREAVALLAREIEAFHDRRAHHGWNYEDMARELIDRLSASPAPAASGLADDPPEGNWFNHRSVLPPAAPSGKDWRSVLSDMVAAMNKRDSEFGDGDIPSAHRSLMWRAEQLLAAPAATGGEADMRRICEALGFDPTNHHNAAKCPYCNPAPSETGASLVVKALEWAKDGSVWFAHGGFGQGYQIYTHGADGVHRVMFSWSTKLWDLQASTLDEAKAAAQADYETRIRAALEGRSDG